MLRDTEHERSYLKVSRIAGQPSIAIIAREVASEGNLGRTQLVVTVELAAIGSTGRHIPRVRLIDSEGRNKPLRMLAELGQTRRRDLSVGSDGALRYCFTADFQRYERIGSDWELQADAPGARFNGCVTATVPEEERANLD